MLLELALDKPKQNYIDGATVCVYPTTKEQSWPCWGWCHLIADIAGSHWRGTTEREQNLQKNDFAPRLSQDLPIKMRKCPPWTLQRQCFRCFLLKCFKWTKQLLKHLSAVYIVYSWTKPFLIPNNLQSILKIHGIFLCIIPRVLMIIPRIFPKIPRIPRIIPRILWSSHRSLGSPLGYLGF